jgi:hypothetical protein
VARQIHLLEDGYGDIRLMFCGLAFYTARAPAVSRDCPAETMSQDVTPPQAATSFPKLSMTAAGKSGP